MTEVEKLKELYSADFQHSKYKQDQTNDIYLANLFLFFIYYGLVFYYIRLNYSSIVNSFSFYKKIIMVILLLAYPFIIYPVQYNVYRFFYAIYNTLFKNIYN
jgi:hypothetical protein